VTAPAASSRIDSPSGLVVHVNANGSLRRMEHGDIVLNLFPGTEVEGGATNIYLRHLGTDLAWTPLLGPRSPLAFHLDAPGLRAMGEWQGVGIVLSLVLADAAPAWFWHVTLDNRGNAAVSVDLVCAQDVALAHYGAIRMNEYYVSQYVDHTPLTHPERGYVLAIRQNLAMGGRQPWAVIGSLQHGVSFATDALQFHGLATRAGEAPAGLVAPRLPGVRHQHEHSMAVIQDAPVQLAPGARTDRGFFGWFEPDHPAATSSADLATVDRALALPEASPRGEQRPTADGTVPAATLFSTAPLLRCDDLTDAEISRSWGNDLRHVERDAGQMLSFFCGAHTHVALRAKELRVLRPHGHLVRTGDQLTPDEASLTSTTWMAGVFNSFVTQGHVSINRFLSTTRSYLSLFRAGGQRIFVELADGYHLLDVPSAYEMTPSGCRWIYKHAGGVIEVRSWAAVDRHELHLSIEVVEGPPCRFLVSHRVALNGDDGDDPVPAQFTHDAAGVTVRPIPDSDVGRRFPNGSFRIEPGRDTPVERIGGDEVLFADGWSRNLPFLAIVTEKVSAASFRLLGNLVPTAIAVAATDVAADERAADRFWDGMVGLRGLHPPLGTPLAGDVTSLQEILPWFAHNAMIHYLAPRGLEQYSGGGWGTRDLSQGPVELLLALGRWDPLRDILLRLFATQNADGDWPQWFMFFDRERGIRPPDSHGDIVFWPPLALAKYILASEDASILDAVVPFFHPAGDDQAERSTVWGHVERALAQIARRVIPNTRLAAYGHGDWNDSLQPADPSMRERLCSAWTVTLHYETSVTLAAALRRVGRPELAAGFEATAAAIRNDFQRLLIADETLAGFAYWDDDGRIDYWLHPRDAATGIHYRLLPMIHAIINGLLTPEQAQRHIGYIQHHLLGPDGARLFDRPVAYRGGPQRYFQRAESSTFFGREIGIMYTHAHLRYAEAMARYGDADACFRALRQATPIAIRAAVPSANPRQANCYYSSSDASFADRYEALERYGQINAGTVALEGGWRVYSSGAGIALRLIHECFLGLRRGRSALVLDPVIPKGLDGLRAEVDVAGRRATVVYRVARDGHGPTGVTVNGTAVPFEREANPYRSGGARLPMAAVGPLLSAGENEIVVQLG
jgi:cellobiose phosphorylase